jgi:ribosomal protein S18 acetylase RimI-like enzyme
MGIRELEWKDYPHLAENYFALYDEVKENPDLGISLLPERPTMSEEADWFVHLFRRVLDGTCVAAVAEEDGKAVGLCTVDRKAPQSEGRHIGVLGISVARAWRGRGIGRALLQDVISRSRGKFELIELAVYASNDAARQLYRSVGFRPWGTLPKGIRRGERHIDLEHMVLELPPGSPT